MNTKLPNFGGTSGSGNDSKYFQTTTRGENGEPKEALANPKMEKKKEAVKKVGPLREHSHTHSQLDAPSLLYRLSSDRCIGGNAAHGGCWANWVAHSM